MIKHLGLPYMGSKRKIASRIVDVILDKHPNTKYVYDLFGGGGAISFEFMQRKQIKKVFYNEYNTAITNLLKDIRQNGITDKYYKFIDRQTFLDNINNSDWFAGYLATCWSFGNNSQKGYLYGKEVEQNKKLGHEYVFNNKQIKHIESTNHKDIHKRRKILSTQAKNKFKQLYTDKENLQHLQNLQQLEHLQRLQQLENLHQQTILNDLEISNESYENVPITTPKNETIIYLDPPYENTAAYQKEIDHKKLLNYIKKSDFNVYASSYDMPLDCVLKIEHRSLLLSTNNSKIVIEKLFCNKTALKNRIIKKESLFDF